MKILRVFPKRTSMTPIDGLVAVGLPGLWRAEVDEVHISVTFTWDIELAMHLKRNWEIYYPVVKIGGPAFDDHGDSFVAGRYLKKGCVFTSRGCPNNCPWCLVPKREGKIRELPITEGNIIMDNNLLACSKTHIRKVIQMLKNQCQISFNQGLDSRLLTDEFMEDIRGLRIKNIWLAMDYDGAEKPLRKAVLKLNKYFRRDQIRCYVLIGYQDDTIEKAEQRLRQVWKIGTYPFAMLYKNEKNVERSREWKQFQRKWTRPAIIESRMKNIAGSSLPNRKSKDHLLSAACKIMRGVRR